MNTDNQQQTNLDTEEISLKDIVVFLWNQKILIVSITAFFVFISVIIALTSPEKFT